MYEVFTESQRFRQVWLWVILLAGVLVVILSMFFALRSEPKGQQPYWAALLAIGLSLLVLAMMYFTRLDTRIDREGIQYRYIPFFLKYRSIPWDDVDKVYVRKYRPLAEYGGWGLRQSLRKGKAFNVSGNMGIQVELKSGKKILIGTHKPDECSEFLEKLRLKMRDPEYRKE